MMDDHYQHNEFWDGPVVFKKGDMGDWWTLEKHPDYHPSTIHLKRTGPMSTAAMYTGRISNACIEGNVAEMRQLAQAILDGGSYSAKRCAVGPHWEDGVVKVWSPRNSTYTGTILTDHAKKAAKEFLKKVGVPEEIDMAPDEEMADHE